MAMTSRFQNKCRIVVLMQALFLFANACLAATSVEQILSADSPPPGIVFEIVEGDEDALAGLLPRLRDDIERLHDRFPGLEIAVVSHGGEQFALQSKHRDNHVQIHAQVQSLVTSDVSVYVCGAHAGWYGVTPEDFPDYVNVAPSGPAQINQYRELDYLVIQFR